MAHLYREARSLVQTAESLLDNYHETEMEHQTREQGKFHEIEASLPIIKTGVASDHRPSIGSDLLSHLGTWNPLPQPVTGSDIIWLLDNTAYQSVNKEWQAEFVAAVFDQNTGIEVSTVVAEVAEKVGIGKGDKEEATIQERLMPFMRTILPGRKVKVQFALKDAIDLGPGGRNAISSDTHDLPAYRGGDILSTVADVPGSVGAVLRADKTTKKLCQVLKGTDGVLQMKTKYIEPHGWGVISDIDDTIKITQTSDPIGILRSTFVSQATPIQGMPELYTYIHEVIKPSSPFFYLSASPYNLYPFLRDFRDKFYPHGTVILRDASWMNLSGLLSNLTLGTQAYKVDRMHKINSWLPHRKMICIGDSTQSDPEAYGEIYHRHAGWVRLILIRKVLDIAAVGIQEKNQPARFEKAFEGIPSSVWHVFETPEECYQLIGDAVRSEA